MPAADKTGPGLRAGKATLAVMQGSDMKIMSCTHS